LNPQSNKDPQWIPVFFNEKCDISIVEDDLTQRITHVPFDVIRQHTRKHVSLNAMIVPMPNRTNVKIDRLQTSKRMFDFRKTLVGQDDLVRIHSLSRHARANHVQTIQQLLPNETAIQLDVAFLPGRKSVPEETDRLKQGLKILFLHGWHSIVGGVKPTYLKDHGHEVLNPKLDDDEFEAAVRTAQAEYQEHQPDVIVGSSRGGAVAMNINSGETPLVLLCPAWKNWGTVRTLKPNSLILHSRIDDVIPLADSEELVTNSGLPSETLIEIGRDHRLADHESLSVMLWSCNLLASGEKLPWLDDQQQLPVDPPGKGNATSQEEASYTCDACGEEIVIPLDLTEGSTQTYVEDCPVCCRANTIHVHFDGDGDAQVWAEPEQDYE
jgi:hypothetical protein